MKKQLNADIIANELRGNSAFFPSYKEERKADPVVEQTPLPNSSVTAPSPQPVPPVPPVRDVPPVKKRVMKQRWPVDIYQDQ